MDSQKETTYQQTGKTIEALARGRDSLGLGRFSRIAWGCPTVDESTGHRLKWHFL